MENSNFDWLDGDYALNYRNLEIPPCSPGQAVPAAEQADPPSGDRELPLLRLSDWDPNKQYDKANPVCIHYDFRWKVSQRGNIRARHVFSGTDPDLVLAPSGYWNVNFESRLQDLLKDENKFPGDSYTCKETIIERSVERSRQRGLSDRFQMLEIQWQLIDDHLEGLADLFGKGRKITFSAEFVYKEAVPNPATAKEKRKKKSATEAQRLQRAADAGLWSRVYERWRCKRKHCKQGPHCWPDKQGEHRKLLPVHLEDIVRYHKSNMKEVEKEENIIVDIEIPPHILQNVLDNSRKRKADSSVDCRHCKVHVSAHRCCDAAETTPDSPGYVEGDRQTRLEEYCTWGLAQVESDRWRNALQIANEVAMDQFLELNTMLKCPKPVVELMIKRGVQPGIALQFVSNINKFQREQDKEA